MKFVYAAFFLHGYISSLESICDSFILATLSLETLEVP